MPIPGPNGAAIGMLCLSGSRIDRPNLLLAQLAGVVLEQWWPSGGAPTARRLFPLTRAEIARAFLEIAMSATDAAQGIFAAAGNPLADYAVVGDTSLVVAPLLREVMPRRNGSEDVLAEPKWIDCPNVLTHIELPPYIGDQKPAAVAVLPLLQKQQGLIGSLALGFRSSHSFSEQEKAYLIWLSKECAELLGLFGDDVCPRWLTSLRQPRVEQSLRKEVLGSFADLCAIDILSMSGRWTRAAVLHSDPAKEQLATRLLRFSRFPFFPRALVEALRTGAPQLVSNASLEGLGDPFNERTTARILAELELRSLFVIPILRKNAVQGSVLFGRCGAAAIPFRAEDLEVAERRADDLASILDEAVIARGFFSARAHAGHLYARYKLLAAVSHGIAEAGPELSTILEITSRRIAEALEDLCVIWLSPDDGQSFELASVYHAIPENREFAEQSLRIWSGQRCVPSVLSTGFARRSGVFLPKTRTPYAEPYRAYAERYGMESILLVPLKSKGRAFGLISMSRDRHRVRYSVIDKILLDGLAETAALTIGNARLLGEVQQAVAVREDFISIAGHELRTPLTSLQLLLQSLNRLAKSGAPAERIGERAERATQSVQRLASLIDELLDVSRARAGRFQLDPAEVDLVSVVRTVVGRHAEELGRAHCTLIQSGATSAYGVWDRARLEQVVTNLVSNAIKYGPGKPIEVRIEVLDSGAELSVRDHGIGIQPEVQARIFDRFERAVSSRNFGGLGLGLWIASEIVKAHGGWVQVESTPGEGATFRVRLPFESRVPAEPHPGAALDLR
jgi:signal transduction histidine kinase